MPATSIYAGASRRDACSLFAGGFVATETLVFLNIFDIFYVSSRRSDAFHTLRRMNFVGSTLAEVQLYSTPLEPPSVEPFDEC